MKKVGCIVGAVAVVSAVAWGVYYFKYKFLNFVISDLDVVEYDI